MAALTTFRQRLRWTKVWLDDFKRTQDVADEGFEVLEGNEQACSSHGVISLSEDDLTHSWTEVEGQASHACSQEAQDAEDYPYDDGVDSRYTFDRRLNRRVWRIQCGNCLSYHCGDCAFPWPLCIVCCYHHPDTTPHGVDDYPIAWENEHCTKKSGIAYELAGREVENTFRDLRSASKARKRIRHASERYYGWRQLKPGQLDVPHLDMERHGEFRPLWKSILPEQAETVTMTKELMFRQAQLWPRPPMYHRRPNYKDAWPWSIKIDRRREEWKHPNVDLKDPWIIYYDCLFSESDYNDDMRDLHEYWHDRRSADTCYPCDYVHSSRCCNWKNFEVGQVDYIMFEAAPKSRWNKNGSWKISWSQGPQDLPDNRGPAVLPYGKLDWCRRPEEDALCSEDVEMWSEQPFKGAITMAEWERSKKTA